MPKKSQTTIHIERGKEPPENLSRHQFYGLKLDDEQKHFRDAIWDKEKLIVFCDAKAGTGKSTIACCVAELLVAYGRHDGIVVVASPIQESRQGYLPGDLDSKSERYFDGFKQAMVVAGMNPHVVLCNDILNMKNGTGYVSCMTHTFFRGINFSNKVIILEECQNYTVDELKLAFTRVHDDCKVIAIGHLQQIDLPDKRKSGFQKFMKHYAAQEWAEICTLTKNYRGKIASWADEIDSYEYD